MSLNTKQKDFFIVMTLLNNRFTDEYSSKIELITDDGDEASIKYTELEGKGFGSKILHTAVELLSFSVREEVTLDEFRANPEIFYKKGNVYDDYLEAMTGIYVRDNIWYEEEILKVNPTIVENRRKKKKKEEADAIGRAEEIAEFLEEERDWYAG